MKKTTLFLLFLCSVFSLTAQIHEPVKWRFELKGVSETEAEIWLKASIESPWHMYALTLPEGGPVPTTITFESVTGAKLTGSVESSSKVQTAYDKSFDMELSWYTDEVLFVQKLALEGAIEDVSIEGEVSYMVCNDENCLPPTQEPFSIGKKAVSSSGQDKGGMLPLAPLQLGEAADADASFSSLKVDYWKPVIGAWNTEQEQGKSQEGILFWLYIFLGGFVGGLFALFTPCVWPIIPMTVSFFLKRSGGKGRRDAFLYGLSIIVIYVALGLLITLLFGASALNSLSTNALFNLFFFAMLVVFAVSFLGAFDITLPSSWSNAIDSKAGKTGGVLGIFLMAFTLSLVSFSCTGPIIGTLLVEISTSGSLMAPAIGMSGFAIALAIPFSLFALFPSWLKSAPKSGGWLNSVKVVLGFLELALSLKFLSVADLAYGWGLLDRELFLVLWIVIFAMLGFYLLGKIKFSHDNDLPHVSVPRLFLAMLSLGFSLYMVPGLWGAPLRGISAFSPPLYTQDFNLYDNEVHAQFDDFDRGMEYAAKVGKPVLVDFSGYGCVNCRKMENAVWIDPEVRRRLNEKFVLITLMVDDKTPLPEVMTVTENGKQRKLKTVGDKWSYLQRVKFGANAQPFYVPLDNSGNPLAAPYSFNENVDDYIHFLDQALSAY